MRSDVGVGAAGADTGLLYGAGCATQCCDGRGGNEPRPGPVDVG